MGCDFDCGQDLYTLARELQARHVSRVTLAIWTSADLDHSGLPPYDLPTDGERVQGWFAISSRALRLGDFVHESRPPPHLRMESRLLTSCKRRKDNYRAEMFDVSCATPAFSCSISPCCILTKPPVTCWQQLLKSLRPKLGEADTT